MVLSNTLMVSPEHTKSSWNHINSCNTLKKEFIEILLSKYYFGFSNKKSYFWASVFGFMDKFEQYFDSYVLNRQNFFKGALIRSMILSLQKIKLSKLSMVSVFSNMLYGKKRKPRNAGNHQKAFKIRKHSLLAVIYHY